jgi:DNA uptake protein ComE-like DNA-binding protein
VNRASMDELTAIPGIGKQTAGDIVVSRPYDSLGEVDSGDDLGRFATAERSEGAD